MSERRDRAGEVDELRTATGAQIASVRAANAALVQLRDGIWAGDEEPTGN